MYPSEPDTPRPETWLRSGVLTEVRPALPVLGCAVSHFTRFLARHGPKPRKCPGSTAPPSTGPQPPSSLCFAEFNAGFHDFPASNSAKRPARPGKPESRPPQPSFGLCRATIRTFPDTPRPKTGCTPRSPTHHGPKPGSAQGSSPRSDLHSQFWAVPCHISRVSWHATAQNPASVRDLPLPPPLVPNPRPLYVLQSLMPVFTIFRHQTLQNVPQGLENRRADPHNPVLGCAVPHFTYFLARHGPKPDVPLGSPFWAVPCHNSRVS